MSEKLKNENVETEETIEEEEVIVSEEKKAKGSLAKIGAGIKKYGKRVAKNVAVGVTIGAVGIIAYGLGKKSGESSDDYSDDSVVDVDYSEVRGDETDSE